MRFDVMVTYLFHRQESLSSSLRAAITCVRVNGRADSPIRSVDFVGVPAMNYTYHLWCGAKGKYNGLLQMVLSAPYK